MPIDLKLVLMVVLVALQMADIVTTRAVLDKGGFERNPIAKWLMDRIGEIPAMYAIKGLVLVPIAYLLPQIPVFGMGALVAWSAYVVINNVRVFRSMK